MPFHTVAYGSANNNQSNAQINAITDTIWSVQSNTILPPQDVKLLGAASVGATLKKARVYSGKVRAFGTHCIRPIMTATGITNPPVMQLMYDDPPVFRQLEQVFCDITNTANETDYTVLWFGTGIDPVPTGDLFTFRATGTTTLTANAWSNVALTFDDNLPAFKFNVVGLTAISTGCIAARIVFPGVAWRPGTLGQVSYQNQEHLAFLTRRFGSYGTFTPPVYPTIDVLSSSADTTQEFYFQCVRTG